jgi:predicted nuclease of restriction endonuclease-like (RecB) superfamily
LGGLNLGFQRINQIIVFTVFDNFRKTIGNNWSRAVLTHQIELELYQRQGKALSNFNNHLPTPQSDFATRLVQLVNQP